MDPRIKLLAEKLINYSVSLKPGENIKISAANAGAFPLAEALINEAYDVGANPHVSLSDSLVSRAQMMKVGREQLEFEAKQELELIQRMQAYIGFSAVNNQFEASDIPVEKKQMLSHIFKPAHDYRVKHTKWCVLRWPTPAMAQAAEMSSEAFEDFYFNVCLLDYAKMSKAMDALIELMNRTKQVNIYSPYNPPAVTILEFSIENIPAIKRDGKFNIPDGEVFTAPVRDSVHGHIYFNTPTLYEGQRFGGIRLTFRDGKIIKAVCEQGSEKILNEILDRDEGARYIGEFALGVNPLVKRPMLNTLFDEKIMGSFHLTPGQCYDEAPNGNDSQIHWDMVCIQTPEYGGGEIWFDHVLIRKDGLFVLPELECLNPEYLIWGENNID